ncbi:tyrosine-type recombinase/integrase [Intestinibacter sp.]|uniref:tyrosine-type recombinase/integrase n=1 Tax=Intestinibacter sp. TaxID=1965304 RepID=UPI003FA57285
MVREELSNKESENIDLIFTKENGLYLGTDITRTPFKIIHNELGIKKCRFYDLRGSYATKILNSGVEIRDVADLLGHRNIETTENFYISSTEDSRKYASEVFDNISKSETIDKIIKYKIDIE